MAVARSLTGCFAAVVFLLASRADGQPGVLDALGLRTNKCRDIVGGACAVVYDDQDCHEGDWTPLEIESGRPVSFSTVNANIFKAIRNLVSYKNDIESLVVRGGCSLTACADSDYTDGCYTFQAPAGRDLHVRELEDSSNPKAVRDLDENIESLTCTCGAAAANNNFAQVPITRVTPNLPSTCLDGRGQEKLASVPANVCALVFDDSDCELDDWGQAVQVLDGGEFDWGFFNEHRNTIESVAVRRGCSLSVYDDNGFSDDSFTFNAVNSNMYVTLDKPDSRLFTVAEMATIIGLDDDIESLRCRCN